jgi:hypothetical protein
LRSNLRLELWEVEYGPRGGYELSLIEKGKNYAWPLVFYVENHNRLPISKAETPPHLAKPVLYWAPSDRAAKSDVLPRHQDVTAMERQLLHQRPGGQERSSASSLTAMAAPKRVHQKVGGGEPNLLILLCWGCVKPEVPPKKIGFYASTGDSFRTEYLRGSSWFCNNFQNRPPTFWWAP